MRVLHLFDRYLNGTMNWAYQLLVHCPDTEQHIAAPILIDNAFLKEAQFTYWPSPFQQTPAKDEWQIPRGQYWAARLGSRSN